MQKETYISTIPTSRLTASVQDNYYDIVVFSHLRWDFVFQRPQHLLSRLAENNKIIFVEEPVPFKDDECNTALIEKKDGITILRPRVNTIEDIGVLLDEYIGNTTIPLVWFYSGAFSPVLNYIAAEKIVYDCMDELTMFKGADPRLIEQEEELLQKADIVFTGGKSLYAAKTKRHHNVHCFPSSVDKVHFSAIEASSPVPHDMQLPGPVVGYYGVIDERIDLALLEETATKMPYVSFVMIGPVVKINESNLPRLSNIHYLGMKSYKDLPNYLAHFDIAMMPFALNDSTKFISPTKTLEFMAAQKPIISTPIYDVVRDYSECVSIIDSATEFTKAIEDIMNRTNENHEKNLGMYNDILNATSWDKTVEKMSLLIKSI